MVMYAKHFGLMEAPFSIAPDPHYIYMSEQHREALAHLLYGIRSDSGFVLLTGEVGTGKTTICRCLLEQLPEDYVVAFIINPRLTVLELLSTICDEFRIRYPRGTASVKVFVDLINAYLLDAHAGGRRAVLIIDEAQNLSKDVLEQIRLLTNLETHKRKLLQIILLGQPELREKLAHPELRQLSQRIIARYHLGPLSKQEVALYVNHRLMTAGSSVQIFPPQCLSRIYRHSRGIPRLVNLICDRALLGAYAAGKIRIDSSTVERAAREVLGEMSDHGSLWRATTWYWAGVALFAICAASAAAYYAGNRWTVKTETSILTQDSPTSLALQRKPMPPMKSPRNEDEVSTAAVQRKEPLPGAEPDSSQEEVKSPDQPEADKSSEAGEDNREAEPSERSPVMEKLHQLARSQGLAAAYQTLFKQWGATYWPQLGNPCLQAESQGLFCFMGQGGLEELRKWNLSAILKLFDVPGEELYATVTSLQEHTVTFTLGNETFTVPVNDAFTGWRGEFTLLWRETPRYIGDLRVGQKSPTVAWLRSQLAHLQGEAAEPNSGTVFDDVLEKKVKMFQLSNDLVPDGIVGQQTLTRLIMEANASAPVLMEEGNRN